MRSPGGGGLPTRLSKLGLTGHKSGIPNAELGPVPFVREKASLPSLPAAKDRHAIKSFLQMLITAAFVS